MIEISTYVIDISFRGCRDNQLHLLCLISYAISEFSLYWIILHLNDISNNKIECPPHVIEIFICMGIAMASIKYYIPSMAKCSIVGKLILLFDSNVFEAYSDCNIAEHLLNLDAPVCFSR